MSLATRCAACGTVFRVVQDQLKVSEGWVRCGRCGDVFNALEGLFDLDREAPPEWSPSQRARLAEEAQAAQNDASITSAALESATDTVSDDAPRHPGRTESPGDAPVFDNGDTQAFDTAIETQAEPAPSGGGDDDDVPSGPGEPPDALDRDDRDDVVVADRDTAVPMPGFVRDAERAERWRRPGMRLMLAALATVLAALLALQYAWFHRNALAARWPAAAPALNALCAPLGCRVEPLRRLGNLAVESSGLTKLDGAPLYRLSVTLRNRGSAALRPPAIELTLTDSRGAVVTRKVLHPAEFGATQPSLPAGADLALQGVLDLGEQRVAGYSVELFYP